MRFTRIIAFGIIGLLLGIGLFQLDDVGFFQRWHRLLNPSDEILNLFSSENLPENSGTPQFIKTCNYSSPEFFFLWNPPKNIVDCVQKIDRGADSYTRSTFIMDKNGNIWKWSHFLYAYYEDASKAFFPTIGLAIGMIIALILNKRLKTRQSA